MILVTGATGLLGSAIVAELLQNSDNKIRVLVRNPKNLKRLTPFKDQIEIIEGDVLDIFSLEKALESIEKVYHCAAVVSFDPKQQENMQKINVEGTANIVNIAIEKGIKKLLHVSSIAALGRTKNGKTVTEETEWQTSKHNSYYAITKHQSEMEVWRGVAEGLDAVVVQPSIILGEGNWKDDSSAIFHIAYKNLPFYPIGTTGFVDKLDVVNASVQLMNSDIVNEAFILNGANISYKNLFTWMSENYGHQAPKRALKNWMGQIMWRLEKIRATIIGKMPVITKETVRSTSNIYKYSSDKLLKALPFQFTDAKETIKRVCEQYLEENKN